MRTPMSPTDGLTERHRSRPRAPRTRQRLCRSAAAAVALLLLISGCSHVPDKAATPAQPSASAASPPKPAPAARPADPEVRATQDYLARLGYYGGPIDGINGPKTRAAVANYQTDSGLPPDGKVSRDLIARLAGAPSTPAPRCICLKPSMRCAIGVLGSATRAAIGSTIGANGDFTCCA